MATVRLFTRDKHKPTKSSHFIPEMVHNKTANGVFHRHRENLTSSSDETSPLEFTIAGWRGRSSSSNEWAIYYMPESALRQIFNITLEAENSNNRNYLKFTFAASKETHAIRIKEILEDFFKTYPAFKGDEGRITLDEYNRTQINLLKQSPNPEEYIDKLFIHLNRFFETPQKVIEDIIDTISQPSLKESFASLFMFQGSYLIEGLEKAMPLLKPCVLRSATSIYVLAIQLINQYSSAVENNDGRRNLDIQALLKKIPAEQSLMVSKKSETKESARLIVVSENKSAPVISTHSSSGDSAIGKPTLSRSSSR